MANLLTRINKASLKFLTPLNLQETFKVITDEALKLTKADSGSIFLDIDDSFKRVYASDPKLFDIKPRPKGHIYTAFKTRKPAILQSRQVATIHPVVRKFEFRSVAIIPLSNRNKSIGALTLQSEKDNFFTEEHLDVLKLFSSLASLAIRKAQLHDEMTKALETRDIFISMASHELRTPLTTVSGYIQLLRNKIPVSNTVESRWLSELSAESLRLNLLVQELLEVQRIKSGQLYYFFKECDSVEIVQRAINNFYFSHSGHKLIFDNQLGTEMGIVTGDFDKLLQMINNLLDNAAKFSPIGSEILIGLKSQRDSIILIVKDAGIGIDKRIHKEIFEPYFRGDHKVEGMGIGLSLVKYIVATHHGLINVNSKLGQGTTMEVKLPIIKYEL